MSRRGPLRVALAVLAAVLSGCASEAPTTFRPLPSTFDTTAVQSVLALPVQDHGLQRYGGSSASCQVRLLAAQDATYLVWADCRFTDDRGVDSEVSAP